MGAGEGGYSPKHRAGRTEAVCPMKAAMVESLLDPPPIPMKSEPKIAPDGKPYRKRVNASPYRDRTEDEPKEH